MTPAGSDERAYFSGLVAHDHHGLHALGRELLRDAGHREVSLDGLTAGHRDRVVEQDLVGHVHARGDGRADREHARVRVGAVAEVLEHVLRVRERRLADPGRALAAHLRVGHRAAVHPRGHVMAADAADRAAAVRHPRRRVVRAARAEVRLALHVGRELRQVRLLLLEEAHALLDVGARIEPKHALREHACDQRRRELAVRRQQPLAALVALADDQRPRARLPVVELLLELALDDAALLLDDDDFLEPVREAADRLGLERPAHPDLEQLDADLRRARLVDAEIVERLERVEMSLAGRHDAEPRRAAFDHRAVQRVRARERERRAQLVPLETVLLIVRRIGPADVEPARRHVEDRRHDAHLLRQQLERLRRVGRLLGDLEADPAAAETRQREAVEAELDDLAHVGRVEHRDQRVDEVVFALMRQRRRFAGVIVARDDEHAAVRRRAGRVAVLERVARAVDAGPFAVPEREHAVVACTREQIGLLRAPDRGGSEVLVQPGLEANVRGVEKLARAPELPIEAAERRAAITGYEARGVQAGGPVAVALREQQPHQRLQTR